jgi:diguanylate cyclase (GGDEF)-like protein/PAS domain S-box-containing protein
MSTEEAIILIVENEHIVAKDIQLRLKSFGYSHTHICVYPQSFFTLVEELNPDLVIMDIMLKNVSGIDLVKKLKEKYENIPVIFVTAHADPDIVAKALETKPSGYIIKPFDEREIQVNVSIALNRYKNEKKLKENEQFTDSILKSVRDGIIAFDQYGKISYINDFGLEILNLSSDEIIGKYVKDIFDPEEEYKLEPYLKKAAKSEASTFSVDEIYYTTESGESCVLSVKISHLEGKGNKSGVITFSDITDKKYSRDLIGFIIESTSLEIEENFFRALVKQLAEALNVKFSFICEVTLEDYEYYATIISSFESGYYGHSQKFMMRGTPSYSVIEGNTVIIQNKVYEKYPEDIFIYKHQIESYICFPVHNQQKQIIGFIGVMNDKPLKERKILELTLKFISNRVSLELQRLKDKDELLKSEEKYKQLTRKYEDLTDSLPHTIFEIDMTGKFRFANRHALETFGYTDEDLNKGFNLFDVIPEEEHMNAFENINKVLDGEKIGFIEYKIKNKLHDILVPVLINTSPVIENNIKTGLRGIAIDISELRKTQKELEESKERYALTLKGTNDGVWDWDLKTNDVYLSARWKNILGFEDEEFPDSYDEWFSRIHKSDIPSLNQKVKLYINNKIEHFEIEYRILDKNNQYTWVLCKAAALRDKKGKAYRMIGSHTDISQHKVNETMLNELLHNASHDLLTGLPNRSLFIEKLERSLINSKRKKEYVFAVLYIDLDRFKVINDSLGHSIGNLLLVEVAKKIQKSLDNEYILARLGGDEFGILIEDIVEHDVIIKIAKRIQKEIKKPVNLEGHEVFPASSIGITFSSSGYERSEEVLRDADLALYKAKAMGRARYEIFDSGMHVHALELLQLETDLRYAIERNEFILHYQPIISFKTGKITGFEALIRWIHKKRGLISSATFIPIAEETGLIIPIGHWVMQEACQQIKIWNDKYGLDLPFTISVNISGKQFSHPNLIENITDIIENSNIESNTLKLEITESTIMENAENARAMLQQLRDLNIQLQIDDFGTGYSSLSYLHRFPVNTLKVDRSFVSRIGSDDENVEIVKTIISLAKNLNMQSIAEGIETIEQCEKIRELECEYGQGYYFSRPVSVEEIEELLNKNPTW